MNALEEQMPEVISTRHVLAVRDLGQATDYFVDVLGFKQDPISAKGWSFLSLDNFQIMLGECPDDVPAAETNNHSYFAFAMVRDVDALYEKLRSRGASFAVEIGDRPWGFREFCVRTPEGHRIVFAQKRRALKEKKERVEEERGEKEGITARQVIWAIVAFLILVYFLSS
jgi:uncharacterized glyoxalase superfamily protein PhnB